MEIKKVVIIGAGLSGIAAATKLLENKIDDFVILEAEDRIGGRIHSINFGNLGQRIDLGGQWIHGEKNNAFYDAIKAHFDFGSSDFEEIEQNFLVSDGSPVVQEHCTRIYNLAHKILDESHEELRKYNGTLGDYFITNFRDAIKSPDYKDIDKDLIKMMVHNIHRESTGYHASKTWFDLSAKLNSVFDIAGGNHYITWKDKGFETVFDILMVIFQLFSIRTI